MLTQRALDGKKGLHPESAFRDTCHTSWYDMWLMAELMGGCGLQISLMCAGQITGIRVSSLSAGGQLAACLCWVCLWWVCQFKAYKQPIISSAD
jgi:hypothetical protein